MIRRSMQVRSKVPRLVRRPGEAAYPDGWSIRSTTLCKRCRSDRGTAGLAAASSARITSNGARTIIVETATASPAISRLMKSAYGARRRDMGRTVVLSISQCPLSAIVSARATAGGPCRFIPTSNRSFHPCGIRGLDRQNELELRPLLAV